MRAVCMGCVACTATVLCYPLPIRPLPPTGRPEATLLTILLFYTLRSNPDPYIR